MRPPTFGCVHHERVMIILCMLLLLGFLMTSYCHPQEQLIPNNNKLGNWYNDLLYQSSREGVVLALTNIVDEYLVNGAKKYEFPFNIQEIGMMITAS